MPADTPPADILQDELKVRVGADEYVFRIPSIRYDIEVASRAAAIRRAADPTGNAMPFERLLP